jgi:hypothetical protein
MTNVVKDIRIIVVAIFKSDLSVSEAIEKHFLVVHVAIDCRKLGGVIGSHGLFDAVESSNSTIQDFLTMEMSGLEGILEGGVCFLPAIKNLSELAGIETGLISCLLHHLDLRLCLCHDSEALLLLIVDKSIMCQVFWENWGL